MFLRSRPAQSDADALAEIQHHVDAASYVFAGSHVGMMRELFGDRRRAFYAQARELALPPLADQDVARFLDSRFTHSDRDVGAALAPLLSLAAGHPQRTVLLAHALWEHTEAGSTADEVTFDDALGQAMSELLSDFQGVWSGLPTGQRRVLVQIAENTAGLYASAALGGRGGSVGSALAALVDRGEVVPDPSVRTGHRVVDPLLSLWRARVGHRPGRCSEPRARQSGAFSGPQPQAPRRRAEAGGLQGQAQR